MRRFLLFLVALAALGSAVTAAVAQERVEAGRPHRFAEDALPVPRFTDPARLQKLRRAFPEVDRVLASFAERRRMPGFAFGILVDGELVHSGAHGVRDLDTKTPVDSDTVFRIASMTKSFTAMAVVVLRDEGKLSLDDPVSRWVPELAGLAYPTRDSPAITLRDLLTHSAGFPEDNPWGDRQLAATDATLSTRMREGIPFSNAPGVAYEYSNLGFAVLGQVVARASGMRYRDFVDARILRPLGMTATFWEAASVPSARLATGYRWADGRWTVEPSVPDGAFGAMGGLFTSTRDLARYVGVLMSAWPPRDDPESGPVRRSSLREMQQAWRTIPATALRDRVDRPLRLGAGGYGYGLLITQDCQYRTVSHGGGLPGFGSTMRWLPDHGVGVIAMGNVTYAGFSQAMREVLAVLARTGGLQPRRTEPSPALIWAREIVSRLVRQWDDGLAADIAADNLFLDRPAAVRRARLEELARSHGACRPGAGPIDAENALRGAWTMPCDRGTLHVSVTLAPTTPPRVQSIAVRSAMLPDQRMVALWARVLGLTDRWDPEAASALASPNTDLDEWRSQLEAIRAGWGACRRDEPYSGDGASTSVVRLSCDRGELLGSIELDTAGRIAGLSFEPGPGSTCIP